MANRYPYPHSQVRPGMATSNPAGFPGVNMWQQQTTAQTLNHPHQLQLVEEQRQRDYLKQQQKLRLMAATSNKQPVNADKLIENLLETKDMFRPRTNQQPVSSSVVPNAQIPAHQVIPTPVPRLSTGGSRPLNYSQAYPALATLHSSVPTSSGSEMGSGLPKRMPQDNGGIGFQLPVWLSSQSPSLPSLYRHIWSLVGLDRGLVDTSKIFPLLLTSGLPTDVLGYIWGLANQKIAGQLTEDELYIVLALVGLAQSGCTFNNLSILNLIPQAPVPNLNLSSFQPLQRTELLNPSLGKSSVEDRISQVTRVGESHVSTSHPTTIPVEEAADDFSDFQSAVCSKEPDIPHEPKPGADPQTDSVSIQDSPLHIKDTAATTPSVAFQGISSSSDGHKFQSIFSLGSSSSRGIGSRLANHSLGAPKQSKSRHHKHHHHHHHHHHHNRALVSPSQQLSQLPSPESSDPIGQQVMPSASLEEDEFSDFQQAKDPVPQAQTPQANDLFPKCLVKSPPNKPRMLKESAIRSERTESNIFFESPVHMKMNPATSEKETCTTLDPRISVRTPAIESKTTVIPNPAPPPTVSSQELLSVEEDKYSALRALSVADQEPTDTKEEVSDDFGDFLCADPVSTEDSFAALAARDVSPKTGDTNSFWPSSSVQSQSAKFQLDDWGTFESTPEVKISSSIDSKTLLNFIPAEPSIPGLASALEGLDLKSSGLDLSWKTLSKEVSKPSDKDNGRLEGNAASPAPSTSASENWLDSADEFPQTQSTFKENEQHADNGSFVIKTEDDDEFGEFIGPEAWPDDSKFAAKETVFEGQAVLRIKDSTCDTQSVSSLELPVLSRHGSLPSLDLKIFPSGSDKSGLLQSWDCSPQGIDLQVKEWCRCLQSCLQLLQAALATFTSISNESVVDEVVLAHEGKEYLLNLLEVYGICRRVKQSSAGITTDSKLDSILAEVDIVWTSMELYFTKAELKVLEMDFGCNAVDGNQELSACGICLTSVGSDIVQDNHNNIYPLEYGGQVYHAACANLWVNCVDCRLPALASTGSLL